jgi:membrane protease YdiL (CAAX protease family)
MARTSTRGWTYAGLAISLLGIPAIVTAQRLLAPDPTASSGIVIRELAILAVTAFVLWIVVARERLPLSSIGLRFDHIGRSVGWGFGLAVVAFAVLAICLVGFSALDIHYGEGGAISRALPVTFLAVLRAGISEEVLYRGFALERLQSLTGSKWLAAVITLVLFAAFHFRQGLPGVFLAFVLGAVFTAFYLWKRDLLATITGHFLVDFVPNVLFPLLGASDD